MDANKMLIGTDFSEASIWAANHAAEYAKKLNYAIDLVHIIDSAHIDHHALVESDPPEEVLDGIATKIRADWDIDVDTETYQGKPGKALAKLSQSAKYAMVAIGFTGKTGLLHRMGSITAKTVRMVDKPILVLVPNHNPEGTVIGCIDFSDQTEKINYWTHCIANIRDEEPVFTHVAVPFEVLIASTPPLGGIAMAESIMSRLGATESDYRTKLESSVRHRLGLPKEGEVEILLNNSPAKAIGKFAADKKASLIVMGRHGHNTLAARLMGTTAEHVLGVSECSTLIVP